MIDRKIINGKTIEFDTEVQSEIYKLLLPDGGSGDANLLDWSIVVTGVLMKLLEKNVAILICQHILGHIPMT